MYPFTLHMKALIWDVGLNDLAFGAYGPGLYDLGLKDSGLNDRGADRPVTICTGRSITISQTAQYKFNCGGRHHYRQII